MKKTNRNDPCPCASGKKYKQCCLPRDEAQASQVQAESSVAASAKNTLPAMLAGAIEAHRAGHWPQAAAGYQQILDIDPHHFDARHLLGLLAHQQGDHGKAVALMTEAITHRADSPFPFNNLGQAHEAMGRQDLAVQCYNKAIALKPDYADAHNNLGNVYTARGDNAAAANSYKQALAGDPQHVNAHANLSVAYYRLGQWEDALQSAKQALALNDHVPEVLNNLGNIYKQMGNHDLALAFYRRTLECEPQHANAAHFVAALSGQQHERPPIAYVEQVFDGYAARFDHHLQEVLGYSIPGLIAARLGATCPLPAGSWEVLDLGCGTGLVGAALASPVRRLVGVDVSLKMLDQAKSKALYHQLEHGELLAMTQRQPADSFDVVVAADVFIYVGKLDEVVAAVWRLLRPGGLFAFTVESMPDDTAAYQLQASGRYAHAGAYLSNLAQTLGYTEVERTSQTIRCEDRKPIPGLLFIWKKEDLPSSPPCATALPID